MRFTRLRLNGFKSFVDPTDLLIADGLTGVVGPNGCGKSNLLEALRWVMGENRPTAMRGGGMEDVIFAGAATRPARNFAEVSLTIDNSERLAPAGFNENDMLEVVRRITRDAGSAYKANTKDVRARDVQMLFADASTGAHSPALVRQGQIAELINAKPRSRRRILEEAAGISGLYQRRHEAELKLNGAEANLARVEDVIEQLANQLVQLARQARQAARYREIGAELRRAEGQLLYQRWKEADALRLIAQNDLTEQTKEAAQAEGAARTAANDRAKAEEHLPPLREEAAIAGAVLQRLEVQQDTLAAQEAQAGDKIDTLTARIEQLARDIERETGLTKDADETANRLDWEREQLEKAALGHDDALQAAAAEAQEAASTLSHRETALTELTEDVARLAARHQAANRLREDSEKMLARAKAETERAQNTVSGARDSLAAAETAHSQAREKEQIAVKTASSAEQALGEADAARAEVQTREAQARAEHSEAEGEANALRAEVAALARLVDRDTAEDGQLLDQLNVVSGYEKALGAALGDDLRAPEVSVAGRSGWATLPAYSGTQTLPDGVGALSNYVTAPGVLARRLGQIGVVPAAQGDGLQQMLKPGQRLVSPEGDLWRWDGFRATAEDAPSAAALRLQQLNRLVELKRDLEDANARAVGAEQAHQVLRKRLADLTEADRLAREARREADRLVAEAGRALSRAESDRSIAGAKFESAELAVDRYAEEAQTARTRLAEAEAAVAELGDLDQARAAADKVKMAVEAARLTMLTKRSRHDELRRDGEARTKRRQEVIKEISGWRHRLETAEKRIAELADRKENTEIELQQAKLAPDEIAAKRAELRGAITEAQRRKAGADDALSAAETALRASVEAERTAERSASEARERRARCEARADAAAQTVAAAAERIHEAQGIDPQTLLTQLGGDPDAMPNAEKTEAEVNRLKRQRDALGAVNLRAEEDAREVQQEHDALVSV